MDACACLRAVPSALPEHSVDRAETAGALKRIFPSEDPAVVDQLVEHSGVDVRRIALPLEETLALSGFTERNAAWRRAALDLARRAAASALAAPGTAPSSIDLLIDVSCTGIAIPPLDVDLLPALGLRPDGRRGPITESGCAAGGPAPRPPPCL